MFKKLDNEKEQVAKVAERWKNAYWRNPQWNTCSGGSEKIYNALATLPETATAKDVAAVIGNDSWVGFRCNECGNQTTEGFQLGDEPDYESNTLSVCVDCAKMLRVFLEIQLTGSYRGQK